jgi:hypothetical protein
MAKLGEICDFYAIRKVFGEKFVLVYLPVEGCCMQIFSRPNDELSVLEIRICGVLNIVQSGINVAEIVRPLREESVLHWESIMPDAGIFAIRQAIDRVVRMQAQRNRRFSRKFLAYLLVRSRHRLSNS